MSGSVDHHDDPDVRRLVLIKQFQDRVRAEGYPIECKAYQQDQRIRGKIITLTEDELAVRLEEPCVWPLGESTLASRAVGG